MNEPTFVLKEPKRKKKKDNEQVKKTTLIYLFFRFNNKQLKYSTGQKIEHRFWNPENQRARVSKLFTEAESLNTLLDNLSTTAKETYRTLINNKIAPTADKIKVELNKCIFKTTKEEKPTLLIFIDELIKSTNKKSGTTKKYKTTLNRLTEFQRKSKFAIDFDTIDIDFYNSFLKFLYAKKYAQNTIGGHIKNVKVFMNEAIERKLTNNFQHKSRKFKVLTEQVDKIYLTQDDLNLIYLLDLKDDLRLDKVRDLFMIACFTGLRFSDLKNFNADNFINENKMIKIKTDKTNETVVMPMHKYVKEIFLKYDYKLPNVLSNQKMNEYLKEIAEEAKLSSTIKIGITKGGVLKHDLHKKFNLVSTHTARRNFSTNAYLAGIPAISIMKITGHRTEKSFMRYIRISQEENATKLLEHPFFN